MLSGEQIRDNCGNMGTPGNFFFAIVQLTLPDVDPAKHTELLLLLYSLCKAIQEDPRAYSTNKQDHDSVTIMIIQDES